MNELQIALALIGVLAVTGVLIYNRLQERKIRRQTEAGFTRPGRDVLLDDATEPDPSLRQEGGVFDTLMRKDPGAAPFRECKPQEPYLGDVGMEPEAAASSLPQAGENVQAAQPFADAVSPPIAADGREEAIEFRVALKNVDGMAADAFASVVAQTAALARAVRWLALPLGSPTWEELSPQSGRRYLEAQAAMQLADRNGPAARQDMAALCGLLRELARSRGWMVRCDDVVEAAQRAASLDKFCADVDVQIGLNIVARGSGVLPIARMRNLAEAAGMQLSDDGVYLLLDNRGEVLFMLGNREPRPFVHGNPEEPQTRGVTLLFDVPRVPDGLKNFDRMLALGRQFAFETGAQLVDDNLRPLTDAGIEKIRAQLEQIYARMEARGVAAGSRLALRLFS
ncbi:MAG: cell division protein ZipA C-terminal FtsZ-binding domain-containing protein [Pseudomonadota bacterium]